MNRHITFAAIAVTLISCTATQSTNPVSEKKSVATISDSRPDVSGHDSNRAKAMLFRWWAAFEASDKAKAANWLDGLFTPDVHLKMEAVELTGSEVIQSTFKMLPADLGRSHKLEDVKVTKLSTDRLKLEANFTYQVNALDGSIDSGTSSYVHEIIKASDGSLAFDKMTAIVTNRVNTPLLQPSYISNRALSTVYQYLGITDRLESDYTALQNILTSDAEIHGMFDPAVKTHNSRGDGILRGWEEIAPWLSTRKSNISWVAHDIEDLVMTSSQNGMIDTDVTINIQAQPKKGNLITVALPIKISMVESDGPFMRITRIER